MCQIHEALVVVEGIREERFYLLTHPHWKNMIRARMENVLEGRDPIAEPPSDADADWLTATED